MVNGVTFGQMQHLWMDGMGKIVISGLPPGPGGVPRFLEYLQENNFEIVYPLNNRMRLIRLVNKIIFTFRILLSSPKNKYIIMHHQSIPFLALIKILLFDKFDYFAIDNSYFCISSYNYNYNNQNHTSCRKCLHKIQPDNECKVFPAKRPKLLEVFALRLLRKKLSQKSAKIYTLSKTSSKLINTSIPTCGTVQTIGFTTNELIKLTEEDVGNNCTTLGSIVFHGNLLEAKGVAYLLDLAHKLPEYEIIIPFSGESYENIKYIPCSWDTGLETLVRKSQFVAVPSLWDNTPEASSLKSLLMGKPLIYLPTEYSFETESNDVIGIPLTGSLDKDVAAIRNYDANGCSKNGQKFAKSFLTKSADNLRSLSLTE